MPPRAAIGLHERFGSDGHARVVRHPGDLVRVVLGAATFLAALAVVRSRRVGRLEADLFRLVNDLPHALDGVRVAMQAGSLAAVPVAAVVALFARRPRMARDLAAAGSTAWLLAKGAKDLVGRGRPGSLLDGVVLRGVEATGLGFPSGHVAVAAALATAAGPHLGRRSRRATWAMVGVVALARMFVGAHLPVDALGGAALGWMVGAAFHLLWGAPGGAPSAAAVRAALEEAGVQPVEVAPSVVDARGSTPFSVTTETGDELFVKAVGAAQRDADLLFKGWRYLALRHVEDESPFATPKQQIEHEAYLSLLAARAGVSVPAVITATTAAGGAALLVEARLQGRALEAGGSMEDGFLLSMWGEVGKLRAARIAHRDLRLANVVDVDGQPWIVDFGFAQAAASERRLAQDVAELLASLSSVVGPERAVTSASRVLGSQAVAASLPLLQPLALSAATRRALRAHPGLLKDLREVAARQAGVEVTEAEPLARVRPRTLLLILGLAFAVHLLLPQVGEVRQTLDAVGSASWGWLVVGLLASGATYLAAAVAQLGAVGPPLALGRTAAVQLASSFANRLTPGNLGGAGVNIRFLERSGLVRSEAVGAVALNSVAGAIVHVLGLVATTAAVGRNGVGDVKVPRGWPVLVAVVTVLVVTGAVLWTPLGHRRVVVPALRAGRSLVKVVRRPVKAIQLFGGSAAITTAYILALAAALEAFGAHVALAEVALVYLGGAALGAVSPTPGGLGVVEAALVAGLTAVGAESGPAIAGVLGFRLLTFWLPILPGWFAFRALGRRGVI
jgi:uncharacterized membrane protein YbhN (UPF0104 family)/membrane-associated phospholipid phosphatase